MLSTVIVIWMGLVLEDGMRKNGKLEREQRGNRHDHTKEKETWFRVLKPKRVEILWASG